MTELMIETRDLRVDYGDVKAVHDLNLCIGTGEIFGLIGPNGAGKTSAIKVLATLQEPTYGEVRIAGFDVAEQPERVHAMLGYMPDFPPIYEELKVWEFLDLFAGAHGLAAGNRQQRIGECIAIGNLESKRNALCGTLSRGMKQRLVLAKTLLHDPKVLLLDEPASGLDPMARIDLRNMLRSLVDLGKTVLISSHILTELSDFCTSIGIMERGHLRESGRLTDVIARMRPHKALVIELLGEAAPHVDQLRARAGVTNVVVTKNRITADLDGDDAAMAAILSDLVKHGAPVKSFFEDEMDVEDIFMQIGAKEVS